MKEKIIIGILATIILTFTIFAIVYGMKVFVGWQTQPIEKKFEAEKQIEEINKIRLERNKQILEMK